MLSVWLVAWFKASLRMEFSCCKRASWVLGPFSSCSCRVRIWKSMKKNNIRTAPCYHSHLDAAAQGSLTMKILGLSFDSTLFILFCFLTESQPACQPGCRLEPQLMRQMSSQPNAALWVPSQPAGSSWEGKGLWCCSKCAIVAPSSATQREHVSAEKNTWFLLQIHAIFICHCILKHEALNSSKAGFRNAGGAVL